jgi:hypothetical protein
MKNNKIKILSYSVIAIIAFAFILTNLQAQNPWTNNQLLAPSALNQILKNPNSPKYYIYSIGFQSIIKNSVDIGAGREKENQKKFKQQISKLPKDANIVIYCGCCPFSSCPNVRPIFSILNEMGFKNHKLLNLTQNIKVDWIDKGYAIQ